MRNFTFWYVSSPSPGASSIHETPIEVEYEKTGEATYALRKHIPLALFDNATLPAYTDTTSTFYPDPDTETTSVDGYVWRDAVDETWSAIHDAADGTFSSDTGSGINVNLSTNATSNHWDRMGRGFILFDTSSIPDTDAVTSATFSARSRVIETSSFFCLPLEIMS